MKAAFLEQFKRPLVIRDIDQPSVSEDEVLVKVEACDLSSGTLGVIMGEREDAKPQLPFIPGTGASGTVQCTGSRVRKVHPGDRVVIHGIIHCGKCSFCLQKRDNLCPHAKRIGRTVNGVLVEFIKIPERNVFSIPPDLSFPEAAIISACWATSFHAVQEAKIEAEHSVAIYGSGGLGLGALMLILILQKNSRIIAIDKDEKKLKLAKELGAWGTINVAEEKPSSAVLKLTGMEGVDRALVMVGEPRAVQEALLSVKPGGKVVLAGNTPEPFTIKTEQFTLTEIGLTGILHAPNHLVSELISLVTQQQISLKRLVSYVLSPLSEVNRGIEILRNENPLKVIIQP